MPAAPTLAAIIEARHDLAVSCPKCRVLVQIVDPLALCVSHHESRPIDKLRFKCRRCGGPGEPVVTAAGNMLTGRPRVWPPGA